MLKHDKDKDNNFIPKDILKAHPQFSKRKSAGLLRNFMIHQSHNRKQSKASIDNLLKQLPGHSSKQAVSTNSKSPTKQQTFHLKSFLNGYSKASMDSIDLSNNQLNTKSKVKNNRDELLEQLLKQSNCLPSNFKDRVEPEVLNFSSKDNKVYRPAYKATINLDGIGHQFNDSKRKEVFDWDRYEDFRSGAKKLNAGSFSSKANDKKLEYKSKLEVNSQGKPNKSESSPSKHPAKLIASDQSLEKEILSGGRNQQSTTMVGAYQTAQFNLNRNKSVDWTTNQSSPILLPKILARHSASRKVSYMRAKEQSIDVNPTQPQVIMDKEKSAVFYQSVLYSPRHGIIRLENFEWPSENEKKMELVPKVSNPKKPLPLDTNLRKLEASKSFDEMLQGQLIEKKELSKKRTNKKVTETKQAGMHQLKAMPREEICPRNVQLNGWSSQEDHWDHQYDLDDSID